MDDKQYFEYGETELEWLISRDVKLGEAIIKIGVIKRAVTPNLFVALINAIVGQQISTKAQATIWRRMNELLGEITPNTISGITPIELQACGMTKRKVEYIQGIAEMVLKDELNLEKLTTLNDDEVCSQLKQIKGIGVWTAEMLMLFSLQRPNILSWDDLAIQRGMRMLYHHRKITPQLFAKYKRRYAPYASVASLYLWAIAGGACPEMKDYAPRK